MAPPSDEDRLPVLQLRMEHQANDIRELKVELRTLHEAIRERDRALEARENERLRQERQHLWTGIKTLITILGVLTGLVWAYRAVIIGTPPGS